MSLVDLPAEGTIVDIGCGTGEDLEALARLAPSSPLEFVGIDRASESIAKAAARTAGTPNLRFETLDVSTNLPWDDASIAVVFSHNFLECVSDPVAMATEMARVLRPDGQVLCAHWDWDTQVFDSTDRARMRRLVHAFADWEQAWMDHSDAWMGRRLQGTFHGTGLFDRRIHARVLVNTDFAEPCYGYARAHDFRALVKRNLASAEDYEAFIREQEELMRADRYFYSITGYAYHGRRVAT